MVQEEEGEPEGVAVDLEAEYIAQEVAAALRSATFADAVPLPVDVATDAEEWTQAAVEAQCNLLLECEVRLRRVASSELNDRVWPNFALFLLGGPFSWWVPDRSYVVDAQLVAHLHQVEPLQDGHAGVLDRRARLVMANAQVKRVDLNLWDRVSNVGPLLASIAVPASFLAPASEAARQTVREEVSRLLAADLARQFSEMHYEIAQGGDVTGMGLEVASVETTPRHVTLRARAQLRRDVAPDIQEYTIRLGSHAETVELDESTRTERAERIEYPFEAVVPYDGVAGYLELEMRAGGRERLRRTFCVRL